MGAGESLDSRLRAKLPGLLARVPVRAACAGCFQRINRVEPSRREICRPGRYPSAVSVLARDSIRFRRTLHSLELDYVRLRFKLRAALVPHRVSYSRGWSNQ